MEMNITEKIVDQHSKNENISAGSEVALDVDQILMVDTSGTMVMLQFEALNIPRQQADTAVVYCDHQSYQFDFRNTDDHRFLKSAASKYGAWLSRPGNGICHQVHTERFASPGETLLGADSHTPTQGGLGMLAIGAGGLEISTAMADQPYYLQMPEVVNVHLEGELPEWVTAKDVILDILRRLSVKGGVGKIFEYTGPGVESLDIPQRCTITNMGTELGATSSVFPSDERTKAYLRRLGRPDAYTELAADEGASYDDRIDIDLSELEPLIACPSMPDNVVPVREVEGKPLEQVIVGSCTNGSYSDIKSFSNTLSDNRIHPDVHAIVAPASKQASELLAREGSVSDLMAAGVNFSESTCGACVGIGHVPASDSVSLRTFNRNFEGRSGIEEDSVYLCSPEVAAVAAVEGKIMDPRDYGTKYDIESPGVPLPKTYDGSTADLLPPEHNNADLIKGPNIGDVPLKSPPESTISGEVLIKTDDNITTDHIIPGTADILKYRSNIEKLSEFTLSRVDETFAERAKHADGGFIFGRENYGQGSSREHAALCPMYLGVEGVIASSFARIHRDNLINFGILPLRLENKEVYGQIEQGVELSIESVVENLKRNEEITQFTVTNRVSGEEFSTTLEATGRQREYLLAGGKLSYAKHQLSKSGNTENTSPD